ncbi:MAG TPA: tetratricopeptide repeat protein [Gemmatimonadaceae bacterium]|nr:tetratricopeptide repeat protein [Gemmatimonadaceae bacterium]
MSNVAKLKKKAAELEQKKQFDKALVVYVELLEQIGDNAEDADVALFNRAGDLMVRKGSVAEAVEYYEKAVDLYAEGGFFNNAIALCNKILRQSPGRASIYYKLGRISAKKGFTSDAKQNYLEYADRMQKAGNLDEAFRALKEFADLCPDQDDIRLMLAEQLAKKKRNGEALEQLQVLYEKFEAEGRQAEARATLDRMKAIDPAAQPKAPPAGGPAKKSSDLVFLDVQFDDDKVGKSGSRGPRRPTPKPRAAEPAPPPPARGGDLPFLDTTTPPTQAAAQPPAPPAPPAEPLREPTIEMEDLAALNGAQGVDFQSSIDTSFGSDSLLGLEPTQMSPDVVPEQAPGPVLDIEPTSLGSSDITHDDLTTDFGISPLDENATLQDNALVELELSDTEAAAPPPPEHDLALPGELPMLASPADRAAEGDSAGDDLELIMPDATAPPPRRRSGSALADFEAPIARDPSAGPPAFDFPLLDGTDPDEAPAPVKRRPAAPSAPGDPLTALRARVNVEPSKPGLRRQLAEALFERGARDEGLGELELAMIGFERANDLASAASVADEIIRLNPNSVRHHQKRVEYAFRTSDRSRLIEAYLELADALFRSSQPDKAKTVYQRVLELSPDDVRAQAALSAFVEPSPAPAPAAPAAPRKAVGTPERSGAFRRYTGQTQKPPEPPPAPRRREKVPTDPAGFVNLGDWLKDDAEPKSTRMVVEEQAPTGNEQADFNDMLRRFKQGVAQNVEDEDHQAHYDLGVAYKEMGLLDEAIAEFQKALRGAEGRVRTYEALGQCFLEKSQFQVAATLLQRALAEPRHSDEQLVGVLYLLGYATEALQQWTEALTYYQRVFAVDIEFRDVSERITALGRVTA